MFVFSTLYEIKLKEGNPNREFSINLAKEVLNQLVQFGYGKKSEENSDQCEIPSFSLLTNSTENKILVTILSDLITLDFTEIHKSAKIDGHRQEAKKLQCRLTKALPECNVNRTAPLVRGKENWNYSEFGDGRIVEDKDSPILFREKSKYQEVTIIESTEFGNTLLLDGHENLSEKGDTYTAALLGINQGYEFSGKTVLILGGGDGAALNCLRKLSPTMITMVEIDEVVLRACQKHLRGCCGDSLDSYDGENYSIIVGDCIEHLKQFNQNNRKFDYIVSDISDTPIDEANDTIPEENKMALFGEISYDSDFFCDVFNLSLKVLEPDGIILTHVGASANKACVQCFVKKVQTLDEEVELKMSSEFVPAFLESWTFCKMKRPNR